MLNSFPKNKFCEKSVRSVEKLFYSVFCDVHMKLTFSKTAPRGACIICHSVSRKKGLTSLITAGSKVAPLASGIPKHLSMPHNVSPFLRETEYKC